MDCRDDFRAISGQRLVLVVVLQINSELVHIESLQFLDAAYLLHGRADDAETVDDLVGNEIGMVITGLAVMVVVIALAVFDVVGERLRNTTSGFTVTLYYVGDVVTDHATEPT